MKMPMQYATSTKILDIVGPLCPLYPSIPPENNVTGSPKDPHRPSDSSEPMSFL